LDPDNGDLTYTEQLVDRPPPGVTYTTYDRALADGSLVELYRRTSDAGRNAAAFRIPVRELVRFGREALVNRARSRGALFREPFRHFDLEPSAFDLIHVHVFSVALNSGDLPIVVGNSVPIHSVYEDGRRMARGRVRVQRAADRWLAARTGVMHNSYGLQRADMVVCWSDLLRDWYVRYLGDPEQVTVVPPGLELRDFPPAPARVGKLRLGFVGDWDAKGGDAVLGAYRRLREHREDVELTIVGGEPRVSWEAMAKLGITWLPRQSRETLIADVIPSFSLFVYPSRFDGVPLTLLEVMAYGIPVVVSRYGALPEVVAFGRAGVVSSGDDPVSLAHAIEAALEPNARCRLGRAARSRIAERFEIDTVNGKLLSAYERAQRRAVQRHLR
jgi:glycosyltransferase involved in cell wall biosynthesis